MSEAAAGAPAALDPGSFVRPGNADKTSRLDLFVENVHCAGCIAKIERNLTAVPGVTSARLNMSTRRLAVEWRTGQASAQRILQTVTGLGYPAAPFDPDRLQQRGNAEDRRLLLALAVAGFAAANVMLLSVAVWAGAFSDMGPATRDVFHWLSALIALPTVAFAGMPFFRSAARALGGGNLNMDVPISLAVALASGMSLFETASGREHAYFDASVTLLFFLLVGRYLDHRARAKARDTAEHLLALSATAATVVDADGSVRLVPVGDVRAGTAVRVAPGDRIPVDGVVTEGTSDTDTSLVTGETQPRVAEPGGEVFAGMLNLTGVLTLRVTATGEDTLLGEIVRIVEAAEQGRARYVRIADRAARIYAPLVHGLALITFVGWWGVARAGWEPSLLAAIAVLIITCPCALGLAVPAVQVVATGLLLRRGILVKAADGLERLAAADTVVFDKTGTLTTGEPALIDDGSWTRADLATAASLAAGSRHPLSRALVKAAGTAARATVADIEERPGQGLAGTVEGVPVRLGSRAWIDVQVGHGTDHDGPEIWLRTGDAAPIRFAFLDEIRSDAREAIARLKKMGFAVELSSGDRAAVVARAAAALGIESWRAEQLPVEKTARIAALTRDGRKVAMVGDGLNDAPALASGYVSLSPSTATAVTQTTADFIYHGGRLSSVVTAVRVARAADRLVKQNFAIAAVYNMIAVPLAMAGLATPLAAAAAMSSSSILVTLNALRLRMLRGL